MTNHSVNPAIQQAKILYHPAFGQPRAKNPGRSGRPAAGIVSLAAHRTTGRAATPPDVLAQWISEAMDLLISIETLSKLSQVAAEAK